MPLQNRVTPFGEILALPQRGLFMGNRGIIHDPATRTLLRRRWTSKAWIICVCEFRGVRRRVMSRHSWTELFFLDEATALAAGHRPCYYCRRREANAYAAAWARSLGGPPPSAPAMDARLHAERLARGLKKIHPLRQSPDSLPDGAMIAVSGEPYVIARGKGLHWTESGYQAPRPISRADGLLTPPASVAALRGGYPCVLHPSLYAWFN